MSCDHKNYAECTCPEKLKFVDKMMALPEWNCPDGEETCTEEFPCEACCEHGDVEGGWCLDCDKDLTEDMGADAYDRAKDRD